ncbi:MAG: hypothetical protein HOV87_18945 [Catenulispora sp.]|nr:hypothetical protein [Catenulispora sp.]
MGNAFAPSSRISRGIQLFTFAAVVVALGVVSWRCTSLNLPDVGQFAGIAGSAFLGGVLNPIKDVTAARNAAMGLQTKLDLLWLVAVAIGGGAIVSGALALAIHGERHVNAAAALTALTTAFGGLFLDTSKITHVPDPATTASGVGAGGSGAGVVIAGGAATGGGSVVDTKTTETTGTAGATETTGTTGLGDKS